MFSKDWTFDMFQEDAELYRATPMKGVYPSRNASRREKFMTWFKNLARDFKAEWLKENDGRLYNGYEYIGDAFEQEIYNSCFSDFYKDTYNQRPHLPIWFYIQATELPHGEDTIRTFCAQPIRDAVENAKTNREWLMKNAG